MQIDQQFLREVRQGGDALGIQAELYSMPAEELRSSLRGSAERRAFWLNMYNAFALLALRRSAVNLSSRAVRIRHYGTKRFCVAGHMLSLNDMEHGMLRHSKVWWSYGLLDNPMPSRFERLMRVPLDPRIHFALNCGAVSCPPIAFYDADRLDEQLDMAAQGFLENTVQYDAHTNTLAVSRLLDWYRGDMGGRKGILRMLERYGLIPPGISPHITYQPYDWTTLATAH